MIEDPFRENLELKEYDNLQRSGVPVSCQPRAL